jgi:hypothetical protein
MAGIDLTGKDPFAPLMPNTNRVLNADIGSSSSPVSLLSSIAPALSSLFSSGSGRSSTSSSIAAAYSGIGGFYVNNGINPNSGSLDKTLNTVVALGAVGLFLVVFLKVVK